MKERYILTVYYRPYKKPKTIIDLVVTNPVITNDGVWATSQTAWGGETRHFYNHTRIISLKKEM